MLRSDSASGETALTACDAEPIHIPGSIQPHGLMVIAEAGTLEIVGVAGDVEARFGDNWQRKPVADYLGVALPADVGTWTRGTTHVVGRITTAAGDMNAIGYRSGSHIVVEMDEAEANDVPAAHFLSELEAAIARLEGASSVEELCSQAAHTVRDLTGYGRVMVYEFVDDDAGVVVGESLAKGQSSFLNHHFPASDIPRQARALYVRNRVRVIPDAGYVPQPIRGVEGDLTAIDLSDSTLRSVSPVHIQYLHNMGVVASASMSIVKDGLLWGLIACHHDEPRPMPLRIRLACRSIAGALSRQIRARQDADFYRERIRLRSQEDMVISRLGPEGSLDRFFAKSGRALANLLGADGFAAIQGKELFLYGKCPDRIDVREVAEWARKPAAMEPLATNQLSRDFPRAEPYRDKAGGVLAVTMSTEVPTILLWFRAEHLEVLKWAGNPHKDTEADPQAVLTPRASFEAWTESVRGKARPWTHAEIEAANRIVRLMLDHRNNERMRSLNRELTTTLKENETLLRQKDYLLKEVNHRVQNSLQLVSAFLRLQGRSANEPTVRTHLDEAQRRLNAVALVHRRLYQDDSVEVVDLSRYLDDLCSEMRSTMDDEWWERLDLDFAPILIATDRAVNVGLVLTELMINGNKYAYDGGPGPLSVRLEQHRDSLRLIVADRGKGKLDGDSHDAGFGSRMVAAIVDRLFGTLEEFDNRPGLKVVMTAPIKPAETNAHPDGLTGA